MSDSPKDKLEKLQEVKRELESKLVKIDEQEKTLRENIESLKEKIAARDLQEKIQAIQEELKTKETEVADLSLEKRELEEKLKEPSKSSKSSIYEAIKKTKEQVDKKKDTPEADKKLKFF